MCCMHSLASTMTIIFNTNKTIICNTNKILLLKDPLLAPSIVAASLSSGASIEVPSMVPLWGASVSSLVSVVTSSPLASGVSSSSCDGADLHWQKAASLVEDGWTTVKGKKVKPSTPSFDMALRSYKKGSKGKV